MTPANLIKKYISIRDYVEAQQKADEERLKPYKDGMVAIEGAVQQHLIDTGAENIKTEFGTAYRTTHMSVRLADRQAFINYIVNVDADPFSYFTNAVSKEKIKEHIDAHGSAPSGIDITTIQKVNFRRS